MKPAKSPDVSRLRGYQRASVEEIAAHWDRDGRPVCLVAPTGAGKTEVAMALFDVDAPCLAVAHRRDLVLQLADRFAERYGEDVVGVAMAGRRPNPRARVQVGTVQSLLTHVERPDAARLLLDEAQHYVSAEWRKLAAAYPNARCVGATATPERADGTPLGDVFEHLVVSANYSVLIADGYLVPARVFAPERFLGVDLAQDPVAAWLTLGAGAQTFVFCARVAIAEDLAKRFRAHVPAACISAETPTRERDASLRAFRAGELRVLTNVGTMTEGIDVPEVRCVMLAHAYGHVGPYLQGTGRAIRPSAGKLDAIVIDLVGSSLRHGSPTMDRIYSLSGRAIGAPMALPPPGDREEFVQQTLNVALVEQSAVRRKVVVDIATQRTAYEALRAEAILNGRPASAAAIRYRDRFGDWPPVEWRA